MFDSYWWIGLFGLLSIPQSMGYLSQVREHGISTPGATTTTTRTTLYGRRKNNNTPRRRRKSDDVLAIEKELTDRGFHPIIGSDESGRGCIAGPVIAASCCILQDLSEYTPIEGVGDSKTLSPEERLRIYKQVLDQPDIYAWEVALRSNTEIEDSNILLATMECFAESIEKLSESIPEDHNAYSIVDGKKGPKLAVDIPSRPWVKGDAEVYSVGLASIIAKVTRDNLAMQWNNDYPEYGFDIHKGYATKDHIEALHTHGPCPLHRMSFKSLKGR
jgi:ribonuclease HII